MRLPTWLLTLGLSACAPVPQMAQAPGPDTVRYFNQGWTAADRQVFTTTPQGSYLMPRP